MKKNKRSKTVAKADRICAKHAEQHRRAMNHLAAALFEVDALVFRLRTYNSDNDLGPGKQEDFTDTVEAFKDQLEELMVNTPELP